MPYVKQWLANDVQGIRRDSAMRSPIVIAQSSQYTQLYIPHVFNLPLLYDMQIYYSVPPRSYHDGLSQQISSHQMSWQ